MTKELILVRHAEAVGQEPEARLNENGHAQAEQLTQSLAHLDLDAIYASPFIRAQATAEPLAADRGLSVTTVPDLRERLLAHDHIDDWRDHLKRSFLDPDYRLKDAESTNDATARALSSLKAITTAGHVRPIAVSHGNLIACIFRAITPSFGYDDWAGLGNAEAFALSFSNGAPTNFQRL